MHAVVRRLPAVRGRCGGLFARRRRRAIVDIVVGAGCSSAKRACSWRFPSFQALGGHLASLKKPRLSEAGGHPHSQDTAAASASKLRVHECSICRFEFNISRALGGHMRRHHGGEECRRR
ncbi:zinc finger protein ZAT5-like [Zingiber officinale]|uniref:zinc finger protein ZAT5-like n=1 Tax=Zingiber officinale TaxID=94328 RepID=UPI001C4AD413|nr:zinc finger protein ZAT5-like [Zingiber officinale]